MISSTLRIAVIIPTYKSRNFINNVIRDIGPEVHSIYIVDDCCPDRSGEHVKRTNTDLRVKVLTHDINKGVGGAVMTGYKAAVNDNMDILVKIDSDGQMDPRLIKIFVEPIMLGEADYTKGNRFYNLENVRSMPTPRLVGNAILSFMSKISSGYWHVFDPTNGYTAIHSHVVRKLPMHKISERYFFETDLLFRLNCLRAVVIDIPMEAKYGSEISNMNISRLLFEFLGKHIRNFLRRIFYNYYLRDMSVASIELPIGLLLFTFGVTFGLYHWFISAVTSITSSSGTVMLSSLPIIVGLQLLIGFINYDSNSAPKRPIHRQIIPHI